MSAGPSISASGRTSSSPPSHVSLHPGLTAAQQEREKKKWGCGRKLAAEHTERLQLQRFYLWVLWTDFLGVNFGICSNNLAPPLHLIDLKVQNVAQQLFQSLLPLKRSVVMVCVTSYLFQMDCDNLAIVNEPGAFLYLDLVVQLAVDDGRVSLQANLQWASLDVHHHVSPLDAKVDIERHRQLWMWK